jgi:mono/diheme cytochrome c family protein
MNRRRVRLSLLLPLAALSVGSLLSFAPRSVPPVSAHVDHEADGAELFASSGCTHCHGIAAEGTDKGPSLRDVRHTLSSRQVFAQIRDGGKNMPPFGSDLTDAQIKDLVRFLRSGRLPTRPADTHLVNR